MNTPIDMIKIERKTTKNKVFSIFYGGLLAEERGFYQIINAIKDFNDVKLIIAGFGKDEEKLQKLFQKAENVRFIGKIPYKDVIKYTKKADLLFALYDPSIPNNKFASPNKIFEAMMCKKPIIVSDCSTMSRIIKEENCGIVVSYNDIESIRNAILKLKNDLQLCKLLGNNGRKAYENKYNWDVMQKRLLQIYKE